jgi:hypothetical protein
MSEQQSWASGETERDRMRVAIYARTKFHIPTRHYPGQGEG